MRGTIHFSFRPRGSGGGGPREAWWRRRLRCRFVVAAERSRREKEPANEYLRTSPERSRSVAGGAPSTTLRSLARASGGPPSPLSRGRKVASHPQQPLGV